MVRAWGVSKERRRDTRVRVFFDGFLVFSFCSTRGAAKATGAAPTRSKPKKREHADISARTSAATARVAVIAGVSAQQQTKRPTAAATRHPHSCPLQRAMQVR